jgi:hypothetical protein
MRFGLTEAVAEDWSLDDPREAESPSIEKNKKIAVQTLLLCKPIND